MTWNHTQFASERHESPTKTELTTSDSFLLNDRNERIKYEYDGNEQEQEQEQKTQRTETRSKNRMTSSGSEIRSSNMWYVANGGDDFGNAASMKYRSQQ